LSSSPSLSFGFAYYFSPFSIILYVFLFWDYGNVIKTSVPSPDFWATVHWTLLNVMFPLNVVTAKRHYRYRGITAFPVSRLNSFPNAPSPHRPTGLLSPIWHKQYSVDMLLAASTILSPDSLPEVGAKQIVYLLTYLRTYLLKMVNYFKVGAWSLLMGSFLL